MALKSTGLFPSLPGLATAGLRVRRTSPAVTPVGSLNKQGPNAPPASLANSPEVNDAYRNLMSAQAQGDFSKGDLRRNLATNLEVSHTNRAKSLQNSHTNLNENGLLNSGIALKRDTELNTGYDTTDNQMTNNFDSAVGGIDRNILDLTQRYQDRQVEASAAETQRRADAAAARLVADNANTQQQSQIDQLMAALNGQVANAPAVASPVDTSYADAANAWAAAVARNNAAAAKKPVVKKPASGSTGALTLRRVGGPQ